MEPADDDLVSSIAPDVVKCLVRSGYFEKLDDLLSPEDDSRPPQSCDGTYKLSESVLLGCGFVRNDLDDVFAVLQSKGGCCDCEVLYNVAETSRLKQSTGAVEQQESQRIRPTPGPVRYGTNFSGKLVSQDPERLTASEPVFPPLR